MNPEYLLIDGKDQIMGRLAAQVAKLALLGKHVLVINCAQIVISGDKQSLFDYYIQKQNKKTHTKPMMGPFYYRTPDKFFRRTCRGMLPFKMPQQIVAFYHQKRDRPEVLTIEPLLNVLKLTLEWVRNGGEPAGQL